MKHYSEQEIEDAIKKAPKLIQNEVSSGEDTAVVIGGIGRSYNLHIDTVGTIAELTRNMLLGLVNPQEFLDELIAAKVPENDAKAIITEINQKIFVPLREQMKGGAGNVPQAPNPAAPQTARRPITAIPIPPRPSAVPAAGAPQTKFFHLENKIPAPRAVVQPPRPVTAPPVRPQNPALRDVLATVTKSPTPIVASKMLEDHEEPHIEFHTAPAASPTSRTPAVPRVQSPVTPPRPIPPPNLPGALPPSPAPVAQEKSAVTVTPITPANPALPNAYAADPYREPIEP